MYLTMLVSYILILVITTPMSIQSSDDRIFSQLQKLIDTASDDNHNDVFLEQLTDLLRNEEGFELLHDRQRRSIDDSFDSIIDGSGDVIDEDLPVFSSNMSIVAFTMVSYASGHFLLTFVCYRSKTKFHRLINHL